MRIVVGMFAILMASWGLSAGAEGERDGDWFYQRHLDRMTDEKRFTMFTFALRDAPSAERRFNHNVKLLMQCQNYQGKGTAVALLLFVPETAKRGAERKSFLLRIDTDKPFQYSFLVDTTEQGRFALPGDEAVSFLEKLRPHKILKVKAADRVFDFSLAGLGTALNSSRHCWE